MNKSTIQKIKTLENLYSNKRAFIICNGPSLKYTPVSLLNGEITFALNRGYLKKGLPITYLVSVDRPIATQYWQEIMNVECEGIFTSWGLYRDRVIFGENVYPIRGTYGIKKFSRDITRPTYGGGTVTYLAMQIAYYMGITNLFLVGMDHYKNPDDVKHFSDRYFDSNTIWDKPKLQKIEESYSMARRAYEADGREIYNLSLTTSLSSGIIPKKDFYEEVDK